MAPPRGTRTKMDRGMSAWSKHKATGIRADCLEQFLIFFSEAQPTLLDLNTNNIQQLPENFAIAYGHPQWLSNS